MVFSSTVLEPRAVVREPQVVGVDRLVDARIGREGFVLVAELAITPPHEVAEGFTKRGFDVGCSGASGFSGGERLDAGRWVS